MFDERQHVAERRILGAFASLAYIEVVNLPSKPSSSRFRTSCGY